MKTTGPRYLHANAHAPQLSYGSGRNHGKIRWIVTNHNGTTLCASEYVTDNAHGRAWLASVMAEVEAEQRAAGLLR